jgi:hypothetical protein
MLAVGLSFYVFINFLLFIVSLCFINYLFLSLFSCYTVSFAVTFVTIYLPSKQTLMMYGKGKAVPLQAWSGPEGSWKLKFPDFVTTAQDGGKVVSPTHWPHLPPGIIPGTHFC